MPFYMTATGFVIACGLYQQLTWWTSALMLGLYGLLVITVWIQEKNKGKGEGENKGSQVQQEEPKENPQEEV